MSSLVVVVVVFDRGDVKAGTAGIASLQGHLVFECTLGADNHVGVVVVGHALVEVVVAVGRLVVVGGLRFDDRPPRLSAHLADVDARSVAEGASVTAPMARR